MPLTWMFTSPCSDSGARYSSSPLGRDAHWDALAARHGPAAAPTPGAAPMAPMERESPMRGGWGGPSGCARCPP